MIRFIICSVGKGIKRRGETAMEGKEDVMDLGQRRFM
jgi:hypothetical protein